MFKKQKKKSENDEVDVFRSTVTRRDVVYK